MSEINNGGAAFPQPCTDNGYAANTPYEIAGGGLSVRDYFAAKAMMMFVNDLSPRQAAEMAFMYADEMIAMRSARGAA